MRYQERRPHERQVEKTLEFLNKSGFSRVKDSLKEYSPESMIHFLKLNSTQYLVVNHFDYRSTIEKQGFDLWLSTYDKGNVIGVKPATSIVSLKTSFDFTSDAGMIKDQMESSSNRHTPKSEH
jgi:hypothetical protein